MSTMFCNSFFLFFLSQGQCCKLATIKSKKLTIQALALHQSKGIIITVLFVSRIFDLYCILYLFSVLVLYESYPIKLFRKKTLMILEEPLTLLVNQWSHDYHLGFHIVHVTARKFCSMALIAVLTPRTWKSVSIFSILFYTSTIP